MGVCAGHSKIADLRRPHKTVSGERRRKRKKGKSCSCPGAPAKQKGEMKGRRKNGLRGHVWGARERKRSLTSEKKKRGHQMRTAETSENTQPGRIQRQKKSAVGQEKRQKRGKTCLNGQLRRATEPLTGTSPSLMPPGRGGGTRWQGRQKGEGEKMWRRGGGKKSKDS